MILRILILSILFFATNQAQSETISEWIDQLDSVSLEQAKQVVRKLSNKTRTSFPTATKSDYERLARALAKRQLEFKRAGNSLVDALSAGPLRSAKLDEKIWKKIDSFFYYSDIVFKAALGLELTAKRLAQLAVSAEGRLMPSQYDDGSAKTKHADAYLQFLLQKNPHILNSFLLSTNPELRLQIIALLIVHTRFNTDLLIASFTFVRRQLKVGHLVTSPPIKNGPGEGTVYRSV